MVNPWRGLFYFCCSCSTLQSLELRSKETGISQGHGHSTVGSRAFQITKNGSFRTRRPGFQRIDSTWCTCGCLEVREQKRRNMTRSRATLPSAHTRPSTAFTHVSTHLLFQMQSVLADVILSFRLLKVGGYLIADDMRQYPGVERAMAAVVEAFGGGNRLEVLHNEVRNAVLLL